MPADVFGGPFATYPTFVAIIIATAQDELGTLLENFAALYGITLVATGGVAGSFTLIEGTDSPHPDFDAIRKEQREKMGVELVALWDVIDAAPVV